MNVIHLSVLFFIPSYFACERAHETALTNISPSTLTVADKPSGADDGTTGAANIIFQSTDGGMTWQDISAGLPEKLPTEGFFAGEGDIYLRNESGMYHSPVQPKEPSWNKELFINGHVNAISYGYSGVFAYHYDGQMLKKINNSGLWLPVFTHFKPNLIRTIYERADKTVFIGTDHGLYKSADGGDTWKKVVDEGWVMKIAEYQGVLIATGEKGILRSTDDGEHWNWVISEGGVGITAEVIDGGFAVITYNAASKARRIRISTDKGITWQRIDEGLNPSSSISSIKQFGHYLLCGHPDGIFKSSDQGKTWSLLLPPIDKKVFQLYIAGTKIYAVPMNEGC